jgi:hypothetical protein
VPRSLPSALVPLLVLALVLVAGCIGGDPKHPLVGRSKPLKGEAGYWIHVDDDWLYVRFTAGERAHRFQGTVTPLKGAFGALELERPALAQQVAQQGGSIQFDLELDRAAEEAFRVRIDKRCARFDLYVDGQRRSERVHLGPRRLPPKTVPFDRCP